MIKAGKGKFKSRELFKNDVFRVAVVRVFATPNAIRTHAYLIKVQDRGGAT